jgi:hypothetical protein
VTFEKVSGSDLPRLDAIEAIVRQAVAFPQLGTVVDTRHL